jgi:hypothetical protein
MMHSYPTMSDGMTLKQKIITLIIITFGIVVFIGFIYKNRDTKPIWCSGICSQISIY